MKSFSRLCMLFALLAIVGCGTEVEKDDSKNGDGTADGVGGGGGVGGACKHILDEDAYDEDGNDDGFDEDDELNKDTDLSSTVILDADPEDCGV